MLKCCLFLVSMYPNVTDVTRCIQVGYYSVSQEPSTSIFWMKLYVLADISVWKMVKGYGV
jgi:hypothetical protein